MMAARDDALALAQAAQDLVGTPFRLLGRDRATGLDCVGVVLAACAAIGRRPPHVQGYTLKMRSIDQYFALAEAVGLTPVADGPACGGDVLLFQLDACQFHLGIVGPGGDLVHAHAGLRRVVCGPLPHGDEARQIIRRWRLARSTKAQTPAASN